MWQAHVICAVGGFMFGGAVYDLWVRGFSIEHALLAGWGLALGWVGVTL